MTMPCSCLNFLSLQNAGTKNCLNLLLITFKSIVSRICSQNSEKHQLKKLAMKFIFAVLVIVLSVQCELPRFFIELGKDCEVEFLKFVKSLERSF